VAAFTFTFAFATSAGAAAGIAARGLDSALPGTAERDSASAMSSPVEMERLSLIFGSTEPAPTP
jgi:hypothetical protein